ncbi:MAG TPA: branched-chain amino acid transaminase [Cyclobacteriaceae bacterium]|nr:branched-chain amino acid transaminase [Cyclobacteriaceae bacterium]
MYYNENTVIYLNGKFIKATDAHGDLFSQSLHYGYGVFEGIRSYQTQNGVKIFKGNEHYERLRNSCALVNIPFDYQSEELVQITYQVLRRNNLTNAYIRPLVYCSPNMNLTQPKDVFLMICAWEWGKYLGDNPVRLCISSYQRPNPESIKMEAKVTGHYVNGILATSEAKVRGFDEALMLDMNGYVAQAPSTNLFVEKDGELYTPPRGHILPGITRATVMGICRELDIPVTEKLITIDSLEHADSAFLCSTGAEIAGIESVDAKPFKKKWEDSLGTLIQEAYRSQVLEKSFSYVII